MKAYTIYILFFCFLISVKGQNNLTSKPIRFKNTDTSEKQYKNTIRFENSLNLSPIILSNDSIHLRFELYSSFVDIGLTKNKTIEGQICTYIYKTLKGTVRSYKKTSTQLSNIDSSSASRIFECYQKIAKTPTQDSIKSWNYGFDGSTFNIQISNHTSYLYKSYWSPYAFVDKIPEAKKIQEFIDTLYSILQLNEKRNLLMDSLGEGFYTNDFFEYTFVPSERTKRKLLRQRPNLIYLDSMKALLIQYLEDTLSKISFHNPNVVKNTEVSLYFSKRNRLIDIKISWKSYTFFEKMHQSKKKRAFKKAFKHIKPSFMKSKYTYSIRLKILYNGVIVH